MQRAARTNARLPNLGLALLAARGLLSQSFLVALLVLAALWLFRDLGVHGATEAADLARLRATQRASTWLVFALVSLPVCLYAAARVGQRWAAGERDWIGARAISRGRYVTSTWCGLWFAAALVALAIGLLAESGASGDSASLRKLGELPAPTALLLEDDAEASWSLGETRDALAAGSTLRLELRATPGEGPTARVRLSAERAATGKRSATEAIVSGRTRVELALPAGAGAVELRLEKLGKGCGVVVLPRSLMLFETVASERLGSLALLLHTVLWLGAWLALALGLGAWMSASTATALTLALLLPLWSLAATESESLRATLLQLLPGARLPEAFALLGDGLVASLPSHTPLVGLALFSAGALRLAVSGLDRGGPA